MSQNESLWRCRRFLLEYPEHPSEGRDQPYHLRHDCTDRWAQSGFERCLELRVSDRRQALRPQAHPARHRRGYARPVTLGWLLRWASAFSRIPRPAVAAATTSLSRSTTYGTESR